MKKYFLSRIAILSLIPISTFAMSNSEINEFTALVLNLNGLLCAEVTDIRPLKVGKNIYEVECIQFQGGKSRKTYIMDAPNGTAWEQ